MTDHLQRPIAAMPICPPPQPDETLPSWAARVAYRNQLPLALTLAAMGVTDSESYRDMPFDYGVGLTPERLGDVAAATGTPPERVADTLITAYHGRCIDLTAYFDNPKTGVRRAALTEWVSLRRSNYCPQCLQETGGAWSLRWRLPWSFACTRHQVLLSTICPGCRQPGGGFRSDNTMRPPFIADVPQPLLCNRTTGTSEQGYPIRPGRGAKPCHHPLASPTPRHDRRLDTRKTAAAPLLTAQTALDDLIDHGTGDTWRDLRALAATVLVLCDSATMEDLAPTLIPAARTMPPVARALNHFDEERADLADQREQLRAAAGNTRSGPRQRYATTTPTDPGLMAALAPLALHLAGAIPTLKPHAHTAADSQDEPTGDGLRHLAMLARDQRRQLPRLLKHSGASDTLINHAETSARHSGRLAHTAAPRVHTTTTSSPMLDIHTRHIPQYLWETQAAPFYACLPGTRQDTARLFASLYLAKVITQGTWMQAVRALGHDPARQRITPALVNRLTINDTRDAFLEAIHTVLDRLATGAIPAVDYPQRRADLRRLRRTPHDVLREADPTTKVTTARRRNSAAWLWADLTSGHPWHAPAWRNTPPTESQREVYRRFATRDLPNIETTLRDYGHTLLKPQPPADVTNE